MNKRTKQWVSGIVINVLFIAAIFTFIKQCHWSVPLVLAILAFTSPLFFKIIFGSDVFYRQWQEEGFDGKKTWIKESGSSSAKMIRHQFNSGWKYTAGFWIIVMIIWITIKLIEPVT